MNLRLQYQSLEKEIDLAVKNVLQSGLYILGKEVEGFENKVAEYCGCKYAIGVGNCTDALILALHVLGITDGDVITAPNSFIATAGAIVAAGAKPVFVDVGDDYNINPELIGGAITPRTRAIMPVHLTGRPAEMKRILEIADKYGLKVVEDAAQAVGACYYGQKVGSLGDIGCFSAHPLKTLNAFGDGGFITTNNEESYNKIKKLRNHGLKNRNESEFFGFNSRLDEIQAAILNVKLQYLGSWNRRCRQIASFYRDSLENLVEVPKDKSYEEAVYHTFIIQADKRDRLQEYLLEKGVETKVHYPIPIHLQEAARNLGLHYRKGDFPVAERQAERILSLPIYPELTQEQLNLVVEAVRHFYEG